MTVSETAKSFFENDPAAAKIPELTLATGAKIPQFGYGTYKVPPEQATDLVRSALQLGYRHIDTAQMYHNEAQVAAALHEAMDAGVKRADLFVTTKLNNDFHEPEDAHRAFDKSLDDMGLDYVDLFLIHWPVPKLYDGRYDRTWQAMVEIFKSGRAKAIGVSNFEAHHLERIIDATDFVPHVNQIQVHPYFREDALREYCRKLGIVVEAWAPLSRGDIVSDELVVAQAERLERTPAQVVLRWALERGDVIFPKTTSPQRMQENLQIFDFELDQAAVDALNSLDKGEEGRTGSHPDEANFLGR
ncbi:oxidoreductase [Boudabousia liubingyangii]|uniref:Oxidoreductase n=1 Tax=Boudabousia liubingyangii TaxID=1921764 RepID=A0A1Q5PKA7_9ACTO|nr:aldo/keto reductase [Boudabousia liubingyangii]OKL46648.1 oxidoreductase [Boudabousia liubingyangii]OKL46764.1 oxidoreductase [Boudabousia liubingyangii]